MTTQTTTELNKRQLMLLEIACKCLEILNDYGIDDDQIETLLKYDEADQDIGCLADDLRIEFELEEKK